jgi:hypothetical protein
MADDREPLDATLMAALTPERIRAATRARLVARARADAEARGLPSPHLAEARGGRQRAAYRNAFLGATIALAASLALLARAEILQRTERARLEAQSIAFGRALDSLRAVIADRNALLTSLAGPDVRLVRLASAQSALPRALMFWNQATNAWTFVAHNLAPLKPGRTYQLWLVTPTAKISAGTFDVSPAGDAIVQATYALDRKALSAVAVTEEPAGGVPAPTGEIVVVGSAGTE